MNSKDFTRVLARKLLGYGIGKFAYADLGDSAEVKAGLEALHKQGAGSFSLAKQHFNIEGFNYLALWKASGYGTVIGLMPLPVSVRLEGLATGLHKCFSDAGIPFRLAFMRGATNRVDTLLDGVCDFIVISKMAARLDMEKGLPLSLIHEYGLQSYVKEHVAVFRDPSSIKITKGMRVALDPVSIDQTILTSYECEGLEVEFVETPYAQTFQKIRENLLDAAIWTLDEMEERSLGYNVQPLSDKSPRRVAGEDTVAVAATSRAKIELGGLIQQLVNFGEVETMQRQVLDKSIRPSY